MLVGVGVIVLADHIDVIVTRQRGSALNVDHAHECDYAHEREYEREREYKHERKSPRQARGAEQRASRVLARTS